MYRTFFNTLLNNLKIYGSRNQKFLIQKVTSLYVSVNTLEITSTAAIHFSLKWLSAIVKSFMRVNNSAPNRALMAISVSFPFPILAVRRGFARNGERVLSSFYHRCDGLLFLFLALGLLRGWAALLLFSPTEAVDPINCLSSTDFDLDGKNWEGLLLSFCLFLDASKFTESRKTPIVCGITRIILT